MANYADITKIEAPSEATIGSQVTVRVFIKNLASVTTGIMVGGALEYGVTPWPTITFPTYYADFPPGQTYYFDGYFTMPSTKVKFHAYSYYYSTGYGWIPDDEMTKDISIIATWKQLDAVIFSIIAPVTATWKQLDSGIITVTPTAVWKKLDSGIITVTPTLLAEWKKLGSYTLTVKPTVEPPPPPPPVPETCSVDADCPEGYVCKDGKCVKTEIDWLPIALIGGGVGLMALSGKKPRRKRSAKKQ